MEGPRGWSCMQRSTPSLGQIGKRRFPCSTAFKEFSRFALMRSVPRFENRVNTTTQRRTVVCAGDSVLKFTEAGGHGQEAVISEALGPWAAKILRHVQVPIAIGEGVYYLDLLQQETVRLLTLEFMGVEGPPAPFWALLLFALCWLAPR